MANPNKAKGTEWESAIRDYLNDQLGLYVDGWRDLPAGTTKFRRPADPLNVKRQAQEGNHDVGDLHASPFILEAKDVASKAVPTWLRQAHIEAKHAGFPFGVAVHKTRRAGVARGSVHIGLRTWTRIRLVLGYTTGEMRAAFRFVPSLRGWDTSKWYMTTDLETFACILAHVRAVHYAE